MLYIHDMDESFQLESSGDFAALDGRVLHRFLNVRAAAWGLPEQTDCATLVGSVNKQLLASPNTGEAKQHPAPSMLGDRQHFTSLLEQGGFDQINLRSTIRCTFCCLTRSRCMLLTNCVIMHLVCIGCKSILLCPAMWHLCGLQYTFVHLS